MRIEYIILILVWVVTIICLVLFIPKNKIRVANVAFLFKQLITWLLGLIVVEAKFIEYPIREFAYANKSSFTFEYFFYPSICVFFNVFYPEGKSLIKRAIYFIFFASTLTFFELILERYTLLIKYINWSWYWSWISIFLTFLASRLYVRWFFKQRNSLENS